MPPSSTRLCTSMFGSPSENSGAASTPWTSIASEYPSTPGSGKN